MLKTGPKGSALKFSECQRELTAGQEKSLNTIHVTETNLNVIFPSNISTCISNITFIECSANRIKPDRIFRFLKTFMQIFYNGTIKFMQTIFIFQSMAFKIYIERFKTFTQKIYEMGIGQIKTITQSIDYTYDKWFFEGLWLMLLSPIPSTILIIFPNIKAFAKPLMISRTCFDLFRTIN